MRSLNFISGLPRSGSTLLSGILRQNPNITSAISSPLCYLTRRLIADMSQGEFVGAFDEARRDLMIRSQIEAFYIECGEHVLDSNRFWTAHLALIAKLYPQARVICCVRSLGWIINSLELASSRHPERAAAMFGFKTGDSVYTRAAMLMDEKRGIVSRPYAALKQAWFGVHADRMILIDYDALCDAPDEVIRVLYERCGWELFEHDFDHVDYDEPQFDERLGCPGLHKVCGPVKRVTHRLSIPPDLFGKYADTAFWLNPAYNLRGVQVLGPAAPPQERQAVI